MTPMISSLSVATLPTLEPRLSLLDERANALRVIVRAPGLPLELRLERKLRVDVVAHSRVEAALDEAERARRHRGEPLGDIEARASEDGRRDDVVHEPPLLGRARVQLVTEHRERGRAMIADESREDERASAVEDGTRLRERLDERRVLGREDEITGEGEISARASRHAVHGADDRLLEGADGADDRRGLPLDHLTTIGAGPVARQ